MAHPTLVDLASRSRPMPTTKFTPSGGVTAASRRASEKRGHTMPGGGFPIENSADLDRAKHDVGRAKNPAAARRWINKRAQDLGEPKLGESGKARGGQVDESDVARSRYVASRGGAGLAEGGEVSSPTGLKALFTKRASHEDREPKRKSRWG